MKTREWDWRRAQKLRVLMPLVAASKRRFTGRSSVVTTTATSAPRATIKRTVVVASNVEMSTKVLRSFVDAPNERKWIGSCDCEQCHDLELSKSLLYPYRCYRLVAITLLRKGQAMSKTFLLHLRKVLWICFFICAFRQPTASRSDESLNSIIDSWRAVAAEFERDHIFEFEQQEGNDKPLTITQYLAANSFAHRLTPSLGKDGVMKGQAWGFNSRYAFYVEALPNLNWHLRKLSIEDATKGNRNVIKFDCEQLRRRPVEIFLACVPFGAVTLNDLGRNESISNVELARVGQDSVLRFQWKTRNRENKGEVANVVVTLDTTRRFMPKSIRGIANNGSPPAEFLITFDDFDTSGSLEFPRKISQTLNNGVEKFELMTTVKRLEFITPKRQVFLLTEYGLPEPPEDGKSTWLWWSVGALVALIIAITIAIRKQNRT